MRCSLLIYLIALLLASGASVAQATEASCSELYGGIPQNKVTHTNAVINDIAWTPDGNCLAVASSEGLRIYEIGETDIYALISDTSSIWSVAFSPDGLRMAYSVSEQPFVIMVDTAQNTTELQLEDAVAEIAFSANGNLLAVATSARDDYMGFHVDAEVHIWNIVENREVSILSGRAGFVESLVFSPDSEYLLVTGSISGFPGAEVEYWNLNTSSVSWRYPGILGEVEPSLNDVMLVNLTAMSSNVIVFGGIFGYMNMDNFYGSGIQIWNVQELQRVAEIDITNSDEVRDGYNLFAIALSPDGSILASATSRGEVQFWNSRDGNEIAQIEHSFNNIRRMMFGNNNRLAIVGSDETGRAIDIWDLEAMESIVMLSGYE